jgi:hypothetical protein
LKSEFSSGTKDKSGELSLLGLARGGFLGFRLRERFEEGVEYRKRIG